MFAGPAINLIAAALVFSAFYLSYGIGIAEPVINTVAEESAAAKAGLQPGDRILAINGEEVERFSDIGGIVRLYPGADINVLVERDGVRESVNVILGIAYMEDRFGNRYPYGQLGVTSGDIKRVELGPLGALYEAGARPL